jgi:hypothetical protein
LSKEENEEQTIVTVVNILHHTATMSDFNYGGTDEESAEIKKLNSEVVSFPSSSYVPILIVLARSSRIPITLRTGRSSYAPQRLLKAV